MLLSSFFQRYRAATPENPRFDLNSDAAWETFLGGQQSPSGVTVTSTTALQYPPLWRGFNLLSRDVAKLPLQVQRRVSNTKGEGVQLDKAHPTYPLLRHKANPYTIAFLFKQTVQLHAMIRGNGYAYIVRRGDGAPAELLLLDPDKTYPVKVAGRKWFVTSVSTDGSDRAELRKLPAEDVLHIPGFSYDGFCGLDFITYAAEATGLGMGASRYSSVFLKNNARPSVVLEHPNKLKKEAVDNLRESWERMYSGLDNAHRVAILQEGMKLSSFGINARDAQLMELRQMQVREAACLLGVPPHKLGDTSRTAYASLEQENQAYLDESLDPWLIVWEEECRDKLLTEAEKEGDTHVIVFDRRQLVRANSTDRANYLRVALGGHPWMSVNEARENEGLNPSEDEGSDTIPQPANMGGPDNQPKNPGDQPPGRPPKSLLVAHRGVLHDAAASVVRRINKHALRAANDPKGFPAWVDSFEAEHRSVVGSMMLSAEHAGSLLLGGGGWRIGEAAEYTLGRLRIHYGNLAESSTARELPGKAQALAADLERRIPADVVDNYLPEEGEE